MAREKFKFVEYLGGCWLLGKAVAVYEKGDEISLRAETSGGRRISSRRVSRDEYNSLRESFYEGVHHGDARITQRALTFCGLDLNV